MASEAEVMAAVTCEWDTERGPWIMGSRAFPYCKTYDYPASNEVVACIQGIQEARRKLGVDD